MTAYLHVRIKDDAQNVPQELLGKVFPVQKREFTQEGVVYCLCDEYGEILLKLPEDQVEVLK